MDDASIIEESILDKICEEEKLIDVSTYQMRKLVSLERFLLWFPSRKSNKLWRLLHCNRQVQQREKVLKSQGMQKNLILWMHQIRKLLNLMFPYCDHHWETQTNDGGFYTACGKYNRKMSLDKIGEAEKLIDARKASHDEVHESKTPSCVITLEKSNLLIGCSKCHRGNQY